MSLGITIHPEPFRDKRGDVCQSWASTGLPISTAVQLQWSPRAWEQNVEELDALIKMHKTIQHEQNIQHNFTFLHIYHAKLLLLKYFNALFIQYFKQEIQNANWSV